LIDHVLLHNMATPHTGSQNGSTHPALLNTEELKNAYKKSKRRMFFMDYDGTLSPIVSNPKDAIPSEDLKDIISKLSNDKRNRIYIISGRDRKALELWLGDFRVGMSAEHGCFLRPLTSTDSLPEPADWKDLVKEKGVDVSWKEKVVEVFKKYQGKLKGAAVESKEYAVTFHYRNCDKESAKPIVKELRKELQELQPHYSTLAVLKGKKSLEARLAGITKGWIVHQILDVNKREGVNFVLCVGDDLTDEDMFKELENDKALNEGVFTCTVNFKGSIAKTFVENQKQVLSTLRELVDVRDDNTN